MSDVNIASVSVVCGSALELEMPASSFGKRHGDILGGSRRAIQRTGTALMRMRVAVKDNPWRPRTPSPKAERHGDDTIETLFER